MRIATCKLPRAQTGLVCAVIVAALCITMGRNTVQADQGSNDVIRVEEDWELVVGDPDPDSCAPQVTSVMSPVADVNVAYAAFDINHHSQPSFRPGGLQLEVWNNNEPLLSDNDPEVDTLRHAGETIRWTQQMSLNDGVLTFAITGGTSDTWGAFGGGERLQASVGTSLANFNGYSSSVSVANSGVGFAGNRVQSLVLKRVRKYSAAGLISEDSSAKVVFPHD
jgi:hypothetical protein